MPQTKILEDETKDRSCLFDVLSDGLSTKFVIIASKLHFIMYSKIFVWGAQDCLVAYGIHAPNRLIGLPTSSFGDDHVFSLSDVMMQTEINKPKMKNE